MIKMRLTGGVEAIEDIGDYVTRFPEISNEIGKQVFEELKQKLLDGLKFYPPVPAGSRYVRTFKLRNNWTAIFELIGSGFRISIQNSTFYAIWVVGSLAQRPSAAKRFQRDFHARHGWPLATNTTRLWMDDFINQFAQDIAAEFTDGVQIAAKRRAVTRIESS